MSFSKITKILGVLLFLIFINDLPSEFTSNFYKIIFADDTSALAKNPSLTELVDFCNIEICKLGDWFKANKLLLNTGKTKLMIFSPNSRVDTKVNISLDGTKLVQYPNDKDKFIRTLGFFIDDKLNLKEYFKKFCLKYQLQYLSCGNLNLFTLPESILISFTCCLSQL